jgi:Phage T7 tail fibre protein
MAIPTPYSYRQYQGDGLAKTFSVPFPYLERVHVHLYLDGKELAEGTDYSWTSGVQVQLTTALQAAVVGTPGTPAQVLTVRRITPEDDQIVQWKDGSYLISEDQNESDKQWLYLIQEHHDGLMQLHWGTGSIPGGGNPSLPLAWWNNLSRSKDPNKGKADELANTVTKPDQLAGDWPIDGKDKFIATTDALSERFDVFVQDTKPADPPITDIRQAGKLWFDDGALQLSVWEPSAKAWVNFSTSGPPGPPGPNVFYGPTFPPEPNAYGLWYDTNRKELRLKYDDGTGVQWVLAGGAAPPTGLLIAGNGVAANTVHEIQTIDQGVI